MSPADPESPMAEDEMIVPPDELKANFTRAGWTGEPRDVNQPSNDNHVGWKVLRAFNGLHVHPDSTSGLECAANDVHFQNVTPLCEVAEKWQTLLNTRLMGIAFTHKRYAVLWIASDGFVFTSNDITDVFGFVGKNIGIAIRNEMTGIRGNPLMADDESILSYYGDDHHRGDSRLFDWHSYASKNTK